MALLPRTDISIIVYAPPLGPTDGRPAAIVQAMEGAFPGLSLSRTVGEDKQLRRLFAGELRAREDGAFTFACNGDLGYPVMVSGWACPEGAGPQGHAQLEVHARVPSDSAGAAAAGPVLAAIGDAARAFWGHATPYAASATIAQQTASGPMAVVQVPPPPRDLPSVRHPMELAPEVPHRLGWWNYWSDAAARAIGFPDPARAGEMFTRAQRTAAGWVVALTEAPLDLNIPAHLDALLRAYERFPAIGGRGAPGGR